MAFALPETVFSIVTARPDFCNCLPGPGYSSAAGSIVPVVSS